MGKVFKKRNLEEVYIPKAWIEDEKPLKFRFTTLTNLEIAKLDDKLASYDMYDQKLITASNEIDYQTALLHISGWENLIVDGEELEYDKSKLESLDIVDELVELGKYIYIVSKYPEARIEF
jgi:hypothetical protein